MTAPNPWVPGELVNAAKLHDRIDVPLASVAPDADWTAVSTTQATKDTVNSTAKVWKQGQIAVIEGNISGKSGNFAANGNFPAQVVVPAGFRPDVQIVRVAATNGPGTLCYVSLDPDGSVNVLTGPGAPSVVDLSCLSGYRVAP